MKPVVLMFVAVCSIWFLPSSTLPDGNNGGSASTGSNYADGISVAGITASGAVFSYLAGGTKITEHGVVYGKTQHPAVGASTRAALYQGAAKDIPATKTFFKLSVSRFVPGTLYYARAYVKDSAGDVNYSNEISFTTLKAK